MRAAAAQLSAALACLRVGGPSATIVTIRDRLVALTYSALALHGLRARIRRS